MEKDFKQKIEDLLRNTLVIGYTPLLHEIDYKDLLLHTNHLELITLPNQKDSDPFYWASIYTEKYKDQKVTLLIPGKQFDTHGTRHGKGSGWYDRFLSKIPSNWVRIGVSDVTQFSTETLKRESWDEPMDWVVVKTNTSWQLHKTNTQ